MIFNEDDISQENKNNIIINEEIVTYPPLEREGLPIGRLPRSPQVFINLFSYVILVELVLLCAFSVMW